MSPEVTGDRECQDRLEPKLAGSTSQKILLAKRMQKLT